MRNIIDIAADRGAYICQSQSLNLFINSPTIAKLTSMHFYAWKKGLKTGMYYLRSQAASSAVKFTIEKQGGEEREPLIPEKMAVISDDIPTGEICTMEEGCISCGSRSEEHTSELQ